MVLFVNFVPDEPSTFILNGELFPPINSISSRDICFESGLYILKFLVIEPTVVKTVSKTKVSIEKVTFDFEKGSIFLQKNSIF